MIAYESYLPETTRGNSKSLFNNKAMKPAGSGSSSCYFTRKTSQLYFLSLSFRIKDSVHKDKRKLFSNVFATVSNKLMVWNWTINLQKRNMLAMTENIFPPLFRSFLWYDIAENIMKWFHLKIKYKWSH